MPLYTKSSLERLREKIDLVECLSSYIDLKKQGATYKALCPFHEEKSPSFMIKSGSSSYHCFGCGAHGDAIQFLMNHLHLTFIDAVELLADRYHVLLDVVEKEDKEVVDKPLLRAALAEASLFFHCYLLHTKEGIDPLLYLLKRRLPLGFLKKFEIGFAPRQPMLRKVLHEKGFKDEILRQAGLLTKERGEEFFRERITFPIRDKNGLIIGFSARKFKEETYGGKYINSYETPLFKKSKTLFGLNYSKGRIAKEKKVYIVEGQIDCLRMIHEGLDLTVASLGTAWGEEHVRELMAWGVREAILIFDNDQAGLSAASKAGDLLQKKGIHVRVVTLPPGDDPDSLLREKGVKALVRVIGDGVDYLTFQVSHLAKTYDISTPSGKNELVKTLKEQVKSWEERVMIHESLKKLSQLTQIPEEIIGINEMENKSISFQGHNPHLPHIDPHKVLEFDLLRWILLLGNEKEELMDMVKKYIRPSLFLFPIARKIFETFMQGYEEKREYDLISLLIAIDEKEGPEYLEEILSKKVNKERYKKHVIATIQKLLDREWLYKREEIKKKMQGKLLSEEETLHLMRSFDDLSKNRPLITTETSA